MDSMKTEYKGFEIVVNDEGCDVMTGTHYSDYNAKTIGECKKWIDAQFKKKFVRREVIFSQWGRWITGYCTSLTDDGQAWCVDEKGARSKNRLDEIIIKSPESMEAIGKLNELQKAARKAQQEAFEFERSIPRMTAGDMVEVTNG